MVQYIDDCLVITASYVSHKMDPMALVSYICRTVMVLIHVCA